MPRNLVLIFCCAVILAACSRGTNQNNSNDTRSPATSSSTPATTAEKIGVVECDDFIAKYEACIADHIPAEQKRQYQENIEAWRKSWRQLLTSNQMSNETMAATCKRHILQSREGMKTFGCEF